VSPAVWSIRMCKSSPCGPEDGNILQAHVKDGAPRVLVFSDYTVAIDLIRWLRTTQDSSVWSRRDTSAPGSELIFDYPYMYHYPDYAEALKTLVPVKKMDTEDECKPTLSAPEKDSVSQILERALDWVGHAVATTAHAL
jgi:hypothetical protein